MIRRRGSRLGGSVLREKVKTKSPRPACATRAASSTRPAELAAGTREVPDAVRDDEVEVRSAADGKRSIGARTSEVDSRRFVVRAAVAQSMGHDRSVPTTLPSDSRERDGIAPGAAADVERAPLGRCSAASRRKP